MKTKDFTTIDASQMKTKDFTTIDASQRQIGTFTFKRIIRENVPVLEGNGTIGQALDKMLAERWNYGQEILSVTFELAQEPE